MSKLGYAYLIFVDTGVKVNGAHDYDLLLSQQSMPTICQDSGEFIFQEESV